MTTLKQAVISQLDIEDQTELLTTLSDVARYGAAGGVTGFIYYTDTSAFTKAHMGAIKDALKVDAQDMGVGLLEMVQGFSCLNNGGEPYSVDTIAEVLYGGDDESEDCTEILNALAWYALERVAHEISE